MTTDHSGIALALFSIVGGYGKRITTRYILGRFNPRNRDKDRITLRAEWEQLGVGPVDAERLRTLLHAIAGRRHSVGTETFVIDYAGRDHWSFRYTTEVDPVMAFATALYACMGNRECKTQEVMEMVAADERLDELAALATGRIEPLGSVASAFRLLRETGNHTVSSHRLVWRSMRRRWAFVPW